MPIQQICKISGEQFEISDLEISLRKKFGFDDLPKTAPWERLRKLGAFWQHWNLHNRKSDFSGKDIISVFSDKCPYPVWHKDEWLKNANPPSANFDFSRNFFSQAWELFQQCPIPHNTGMGSQNSEYTDDWWYSKNGYLCHSGYKTEDLKYSYRVIEGKNSHFAIFSNNFELCIDIINSDNCYNSKYILHSQNISNSSFLYDCRNCSDCMFCFNQRNKTYCFGNIQYTKEEYKKKINSWNLQSRKSYEKAKRGFAQMMEKNAFHQARMIHNTEMSSGNYQKNCNNCYNCYFLDDEEECVNVVRGAKNSKTCLDTIDNSLNSELIFSSLRSLDHCYNNQFCFDTPQSKFMKYCAYCFQCEHCFGCAGLVGKKYYIFNTEYSPENYEILKNKIISHMKNTREWGQFFPGIFAPNPYNESWSSFYWKLSKEEQRKLGFRTSEISKKKNISYVSPENIPDSVSEISRDPEKKQELLQKIFWDTEFSRPFKISEADIEFSEKMSVPLPYSYYMKRIQENFSWMPFNGKLRDCHCGKCQKKIQTSWDKKYSQKILCEECYLETVY